MPPTPEFCMGDTNMLVYFGVTPNASPKICVTPTPTPDASQWNIGGVGSQRNFFALAMYISCCLSHLGTQRECYSQWNMGFIVCDGKWVVTYFLFESKGFAAHLTWIVFNSRVEFHVDDETGPHTAWWMERATVQNDFFAK